jgi:16S rRNA processing protein RimM
MDQPERRSDTQTTNRQQISGSEGKNAGTSEPEFLIVGQIIRPHGVRGEVGVKVMTDYPERLATLDTLFVGSEHQPYGVQRLRRHEDRMIIHFAGLRDRDQAERLRNQFVYIHIDDAVPLEDGEYYLYQVEGIRVVSDDGQELGRLTGLIETGANDVYVVTSPDGNEILLPVIPQVIQKVDIPGGVMTVHLIEGLIE